MDFYGLPGERDVCIAFIRGISDGYYLGLLHGSRQKGKFCFPQPPEDPPDVTQAELIVKKFLVDHPERLHEPASTLVTEALIRAFGCEKNFR